MERVSEIQREHKVLEKDMMTLHKAGTEQDMLSKALSSSLLDIWAWLKSYLSSRNKGIAVAAQQGHPFQKISIQTVGSFTIARDDYCGSTTF